MQDALGHTIRVGDTVLTAAYWSPIPSLVTKVVKVTKTRVYVNIKTWDFLRKENSTWKKVVEYKDIARYPYQVIVVDAQLRSNKRKFPENFV